jgi:hypothetical protein
LQFLALFPPVFELKLQKECNKIFPLIFGYPATIEPELTKGGNGYIVTNSAPLNSGGPPATLEPGPVNRSFAAL